MTEKNKFLVIGAGSIGTRHIKNLLNLGVDMTVVRYRKDLKDDINKFDKSIKTADTLEAALENSFDAAIISNTTDLHVDTAIKVAEKGINLFIEKPLSNSLYGLDVLTRLVAEKNLVAEIGFMMRFHPNLIKIHKMISDNIIGKPYFARAVVGQYLPDWRPNTDYKSCYSAIRKRGGGVILDLIHELDLMQWFFGDVKEVSSMIAYAPELEIETESIAQIQLDFMSGVIAQVHMDYVRPAYHRSIEVVGSGGQLTWDYLNGKVYLTQHDIDPKKIDDLPAGFERNTLFLNNIKHFLTRLNNMSVKSSVSLSEGIKVQRVALAAFKSHYEKRFIKPSEVEEDFNILRYQ